MSTPARKTEEVKTSDRGRRFGDPPAVRRTGGEREPIDRRHREVDAVSDENAESGERNDPHDRGQIVLDAEELAQQ